MAVVARDGIEPPPLQQFLFSEKNTRYAGRTSAACLSYHWSLFKKWEFAGISAGFSFVGAERTAQKTKWRWRQSRANRSTQRLELEHIAPHDLRRTCAKLCHSNGGELEQIQFLLGHASVLATERYLGCKQNLEQPVNDRFGPLIAFKEMETS
jgi:integrase